MPGEIVQNKKCITCSPGSYSFTWNSTECSQCMANANCLGGTFVYANSGYWRLNKNSTLFYECLLPISCNGEYNQTAAYPVNCATGYEGVLCAQCSFVDGKKYERVGNYECDKCPDSVMNAFKVIGLCLLVLLFLVIQIVINLRKREESQISILMRILTNYLQVITAVLSFNIKFPSILTEVFSPINKIGSSSEPFVSFDCFVQNSNLELFTPSPSIFKIFLSSILPLIFFVCSVLTWSLLYFLLNKWCSNFKRNLIVSNIVILFILYPTITRSFLSLFQCVIVDPQESRVSISVNIVCYSSEHIFWLAVIGIPSMLIWSFGIPLSGFLLLYKNRNNLNDPEIMKYYLMLYQGLKQDRYYWELMNTVRKLTILLINALLSTYSLFFRILPLVILLMFFYRVQLYLNPYKLTLNNKLERIEIISGAIALFGGIIFIDQQNEVNLFNFICFCVILIFHCYFLTYWIYCVLSTFKKKHRVLISISSILQFFLQIDEGDEESAEIRPQSKKTKKSKKHFKVYKQKLKNKKFINKKKMRSKLIKKSEREKLSSNRFGINSNDESDFRMMPIANQSSSKINKSYLIEDSAMHHPDISVSPKKLLQFNLPNELMDKHFSRNFEEDSKSIVNIFKNNSKQYENSISSDSLQIRGKRKPRPIGQNALTPFTFENIPLK